MWYIVFVIWLLLPLITYLLYWYEVASSDERRKLESRLGGDLKYAVARAYLGSLIFLPIVVLVYPFGWLFGGKPKQINAPSGTIICIHGLYHNPSAWTVFRFIAKIKGYQVICLSYYPWQGSFVDISERLYREVFTYIKTCSKPLIFVGHSLGGLIAGRIVSKLVKNGVSVSKLITLGTPFKGSKLTVFTSGRLARSIDYGNPILEETKLLLENLPLKCVQYWSPTDNMVIPPSSLYTVPKGWEEQMTSPMCHMTNLFRPTLLASILHK